MPRIYGKSKIGKNTYIAESVIIGHPAKDEKQLLLANKLDDVAGAIVGNDCILRDFGVLYSHAVLGDKVQTGHHWMVREHTTVGEASLIGSGVVIDDHCRIGKRVSIQSRAYIPTNTVIDDDVFIGPCACFTNDKFMGRGDTKLAGAHVERGARIGANATILPNLTIGHDSLVAAGAVVVKDVPPYLIVAGVPASPISEVPKDHRKY
jgi:acetyltransferase-like isoleucine patch superfamily enzyme